MIELNWFMVPFRYFQQYGDSKPYLTRFQNTINQYPFLGFGAGSLLFLGATPTSYIPVTPDAKLYTQGLETGADAGLLCNVKLRFLYTSREGTDVPDSSNPLLTANRNRVAAGHNLLINYSDRRYYYTATEPTLGSDAGRHPSFDSFPFQLLFTDPLYQQPGGVI
ncbi:hypothetical protein GobsT_12280 [Gemmata obscuriglobus]|uniref:Uncharacterized protein n=2 Tax=Gemmata obscuriglobus TaxID=114 RepID=A0A2Z3H2Q6_9BACT|nr:hypothetical protein [Gemmata obscuriglobus]AWM40303.1 hypothetical protein C1280_27070 [Gemmata obscuriglobus]QEG26488.1 hypothetical protein GobsT_12280 [Gemmata obscuriglobus]VTS01752.1 unnamed protein product [Gemmata obscuriglobus UQM 2246]